MKTTTSFGPMDTEETLKISDKGRTHASKFLSQNFFESPNFEESSNGMKSGVQITL